MRRIKTHKPSTGLYSFHVKHFQVSAQDLVHFPSNTVTLHFFQKKNEPRSKGKCELVLPKALPEEQEWRPLSQQHKSSSQKLHVFFCGVSQNGPAAVDHTSFQWKQTASSTPTLALTSM
ncbi:hypothetical protein XENORESO_017406 [Xenotaenia resolanae]|uniref:Uncharacterized protein n=1 Tax=Xenotaenia resolanae TaxID=208358 RepID=A0ABV0W4A8_9TELE